MPNLVTTSNLSRHQRLAAPGRHVALVSSACIATALGLAACGSSSPASNSGSSTSSGAVKNVALVSGIKDSPFYAAIDCGAKTEAKKLGVSYSYAAPPTFDAAAQTPVLDSVIAKQPQAILIAPTDKVAMFQPMHQAKAAKIKLITVDTQLQDASDVSSQISSDNLAGGALGADTMAGSGDRVQGRVGPGRQPRSQGRLRGRQLHRRRRADRRTQRGRPVPRQDRGI